MPADQNRAELVRQARLLNQEIDAALAAMRARAQAAKAAKRGEALRSVSRLVFNCAVWLSAAIVVGALTICVLM
jgi:hypothetical protein